MTMTKFQKGKKYTYKYDTDMAKEYLCVYADNDVAVMRRHSELSTFAVSVDSLFKPDCFHEVVPSPLRFNDLKVGEKFRWRSQRDCGPVVCMKVSPYNNTSFEAKWGWVVLEGPEAGACWDDDGFSIVEKVI
jgi:hypothetical protein